MHIAKAKPSFPPYARPAFLSAQRSFVFGFIYRSNKLEIFPVSRTASGEICQNNGGPEYRKGIAIVAEALAWRERSGATFCSPWFWLICSAKALCGKEASLLTAFLVTFVATKVTRPSAAMSGTEY
jgi:hypothetical protein